MICLKCSFLVAHLSILHHFQIPTVSLPSPHYFLRIPWTLDISVESISQKTSNSQRKGREENARGIINFSKHLGTEYSPSCSLKTSGHDPELLSRSLAQSSSWSLFLYSIPLFPIHASPPHPFLSGIPTRISNV